MTQKYIKINKKNLKIIATWNYSHKLNSFVIMHFRSPYLQISCFKYNLKNLTTAK